MNQFRYPGHHADRCSGRCADRPSGPLVNVRLLPARWPAVLLGVWLLLGAGGAGAQELNCTVNINADQLVAQQKTDPAYFSQLRSVMTELLNNRRWTADQYAPEERITCSLNINLLRSVTQGAFEGTAQVVINRPVWGSNYETVTFSYVDRAFNFVYLPTQPVFYRENVYSDELTTLLAYYANVILAVDYDSFGKQGGNLFVQRAYALVNLAQQSSPNAAWGQSGDNRNRYWLIENLQSQQFLPFRDAVYTYHRLGLDGFANNPVAARKTAFDLLTTIRAVTQQRPNAVLINAFFDAKADELYNIFFEANEADRKRAFELLSFLDPAKTETYRKLLTQ
jgi:hypothetical protein